MFYNKTQEKLHLHTPSDNLSGFISEKSKSGVCDEFCSDSVENPRNEFKHVESQNAIHEDTQAFNEMMENQYGDFEFSYYYVESKGQNRVRGGRN